VPLNSVCVVGYNTMGWYASQSLGLGAVSQPIQVVLEEVLDGSTRVGGWTSQR
jgi:hypothetical protein